MNKFAVISSPQNMFKYHAIVFEAEEKKKGTINLDKKLVAYLKHEYKLHLYFNMPQSVIGYQQNIS